MYVSYKCVADIVSSCQRHLHRRLPAAHRGAEPRAKGGYTTSTVTMFPSPSTVAAMLKAGVFMGWNVIKYWLPGV